MNLVRIIIITILLIILFFDVSLILLLSLSKPPKNQIIISHEKEKVQFNIDCQREPVKCNTVEDCNDVCLDNIKLDCIEVNTDDLSNSNSNSKQKYCLPKKPDIPCNEKNGGVWSWTGWASSDHMEWNCLCRWPSYFGGKGCEELNPGICGKGMGTNYEGTFTMPADSNKPPTQENCECPNGTSKLITFPSQYPLCVPNQICNNKNSCEGIQDPKNINSVKGLYSNTEFIECKGSSTAMGSEGGCNYPGKDCE